MDKGLMDKLNGREFQQWKLDGWRGANGKPLSNADLLRSIDALMAGRKVSFLSNPTQQPLAEVQAEAKTALRHWFIRNHKVRRI